MAIVSNLTVDQGATFNAQIDISDDSGNTQNLTGYSVAGQIRKSYDSTTYTAFSASVSNATGGTVSIALTAAQTNALASGRYVYDVEITSSGGVVTRVLEGQVEVTPGVTRA
jgi:hypothetical protein